MRSVLSYMLAFILVLEDNYIGFDRVNATRFPYADLFHNLVCIVSQISTKSS